LASNFEINPVQVKNRILRSSDQVQGLHDHILTGGRVNAYHSVIAVIEGPHIYRIFPDNGPIGSHIAIYGSEFGSQPGRVIFNGSHEAIILSWNEETIMAVVPEGVMSGPVSVITNSGTSNGYVFTVSVLPAEMKISFPHLIRTESSNPVVLIANPQNKNIIIVMKFLNSDCGIHTQLNVLLKPFEKRFIMTGTNDEGCYEYSLVCKSDDFFGAAVLSREDVFARLIVMPHIIGEPFE
jgi:hypothetical protein